MSSKILKNFSKKIAMQQTWLLKRWLRIKVKLVIADLSVDLKINILSIKDENEAEIIDVFLPEADDRKKRSLPDDTESESDIAAKKRKIIKTIIAEPNPDSCETEYVEIDWRQKNFLFVHTLWD